MIHLLSKYKKEVFKVAKKRKNNNYITRKSVAAHEAAIIRNENDRKKRTALTIIFSSILVVALVVGVIFYAVSHGWGTDMTVTHHAEIEIEGYGTIHLELYGKEAPKTVDNFVKLAESGFYNGLTFHRIISGFMMQGGDPNADNSGNSGKNIFGEFEENGFKNAIKHESGTISMARANDPNSASCQFFIVHKTSASNSKSLDNKYAAFGKVTSGMDIVNVICDTAEPVDSNGKILPSEQPVIKSITIHAVH